MEHMQTFKPCDKCQNHRHTPVGPKCTAPAFRAGPEPLFYAVRKCGEKRDWFVEKK